MKVIISLFCVLLLFSCSTSLRLAVPDVFKEQATMEHVNGAKKRKMSFGKFTTTKIKRGMHVSYPGWNRGFILENMLLNQVGIHKSESVVKEKNKYRFSLSDGSEGVEIFAKETELTRNTNFRLGKGNGILNNFERTENYEYIFSAVITPQSAKENKSWELMMSNIYDRKKENKVGLFTIIKQDDNGLATNGQDTIFIKGLAIKKTETAKGKTGNFPIEMLSGYELSTSDGVIAIIDLIDKNIWFYNELENRDRLIIGSIATAIFARRVKDTW